MEHLFHPIRSSHEGVDRVLEVKRNGLKKGTLFISRVTRFFPTFSKPHRPPFLELNFHLSSYGLQLKSILFEKIFTKSNSLISLHDSAPIFQTNMQQNAGQNCANLLGYWIWHLDLDFFNKMDFSAVLNSLGCIYLLEFP